MNKFFENSTKKISPKSRGITVIETLVVITLVSFISVVLLDIFITHGRIFNLGSVSSDFQLQGAQTMEAVGRAVRVADRVLSSKIINAVSYSASSEVLIVEMPSIDVSGQVISEKFDYAAVYLSGDKIFISQEADPASSRPNSNRALADSVSQLQFVYESSNYDDVSSVTVRVAMSKDISGKTKIISIEKNFNLENK